MSEPRDKPVPPLPFPGGIRSIRSLIFQLMEAERIALLEGQESLSISGSFQGWTVELYRDLDGKLLLQLADGLPS